MAEPEGHLRRGNRYVPAQPALREVATTVRVRIERMALPPVAAALGVGAWMEMARRRPGWEEAVPIRRHPRPVGRRRFVLIWGVKALVQAGKKRRSVGPKYRTYLVRMENGAWVLLLALLL